MQLDNLKLAGTFLFAGVAQFILAMIIAEALYPGYSTSANFISDLGVGPSAAIFNTSIVLLGIAFIVATILIHRALKQKLFTIFLALTGIGTAGVGIFTGDFLIVHVTVSLIAFVSGSLASIFSYRLIRSPLKYASVILGLLGLSAFIISISGSTLGLGPGGIERMIVYPLLIWGLGVSGYLTSKGKDTTHRQET